MFSHFLKNRRHKRHLKNKLLGNEKSLWDVDLLRNKYKAMREGIRLEYNRLQEREDGIIQRVKTEKEKDKPDKEILDGLQKAQDKVTPDIAQLKSQMGEIDTMIDGEGGINEKTEEMRSIRELINETLKQL